MALGGRSDTRFRDLFLEILGLTDHGLAAGPQFLQHRANGAGRVRTALLCALGRAGWRGGAGRFAGARGVRRSGGHRGRGDSHGGQGRESLPGGWAWSECAAGIGAGKRVRVRQCFRAAGERKRGYGHRRGAGGVARSNAPRAAGGTQNIVPGSGVRCRGDQAGAGKLQAAVSLYADHRATDRSGGGTVERQQDCGVDARA